MDAAAPAHPRARPPARTVLTSSRPARDAQVSGGSLEELYDMGEVLGQGHFAVVRRGRHRETGEEVAVKAIAKGGTANVRSEVEILRRIGSHPNIVALKDVFETEKEWLIVMELVTGGELFERLVQQGAYSEKEASSLMRQIGTAIGYLHSQGVCHRDLKPENVLLSSAGDGPIQIKICDFGLSVALAQDGKLSEKQGTWAYWAPEMFGESRYLGKEVDMWSLGVILYILLSGRHPFDAPGRSDAKMRGAIQTAQLSFEHEVWGHVSQPAKDLIRALLQLNPTERPDAAAILRHPWIEGDDVSAVPIRDAAINLQEFQRVKKKLRTALIASMHQQAAIRKRHSNKTKSPLEDGPPQRDRAQPPPHGAAATAAAAAAAAAAAGGAVASDAGPSRAAAPPPPPSAPGAADLDITQLVESDLLADAFAAFDPEGKGFVLTAELPALIAKLGQQVTPHEVHQMIRAMDVEGTGKIHYQEYLSMASASVQDQRRTFPAGTVIFKEGDTSDYFYLITAGRVRKITDEEYARAVRQSAPAIPADEELTPGDYFGTSAILGSGYRHSTMVAVTDVQVLALGRDDFSENIERSASGAEPPPRRAVARAPTSPSRDASGAGTQPQPPPPQPQPQPQQKAATRAMNVGSVGGVGGVGGAGGAGSPQPWLFSEQTRTERSLRFIKMMSLNERRRYTHGDALFREGETAGTMFIIKSGRVEVSCSGSNGRKHLIGHRANNESCGETSCLLHKPRATTVRCVSDEGCEAVCVSRDEFLELVRGSWDVRQSLIAISERHKRERQRRVSFHRTREEAGWDDEGFFAD